MLDNGCKNGEELILCETGYDETPEGSPIAERLDNRGKPEGTLGSRSNSSKKLEGTLGGKINNQSKRQRNKKNKSQKQNK